MVRQLGRPRCERCISSEGIEVWTVHYPRLFRGSYRTNATRRANQLQLRRAALCLKQQIEHSGVSVQLIHSQSILNADVALQFSRVLQVPFILTEHQQCGLVGWNRGQVSAMQYAVHEASAVTACSRDKIRQFAASGVYFPITSIGNLVSSRYFYPSEQSNPRDRVRLVTTGAMSPIKDHDSLFQALASVAKRLPNQPISFTWLGCDAWGGSRGADASKLLAQFSLGHITATIIPSASRVEVGNILRSSDIFVFSSLSEGMPVSVLEALACGLPVVTTNCGGVDEVIDRSNGEIVPVGDSDRLANAIAGMIEQLPTIDRAQISKAINDRFGSEAFARMLQRLYFGAIEQAAIKTAAQDTAGVA